MQIEEFQNSWSRASDDFEKRRALGCTFLEHVLTQKMFPFDDIFMLMVWLIVQQHPHDVAPAYIANCKLTHDVLNF